MPVTPHFQHGRINQGFPDGCSPHCQPSANRLLTAFLARKEQLLSACHDLGGLFEIRFLRRLVCRGQAAVAVVTSEAGALVANTEGVQATVAEVTDPAGPGGAAVTPAERRRLDRKIARLHRATRHHHANLVDLS